MKSDADIGGFQAFEDGCLTRLQTFQKFFEQQELRDWIQATLGEMPVAAAPGVFYVFRESERREQFVSSRYRRRIAAPRVRLSDRLFEENQAALQTLITFVIERGRLPDAMELDNAAELDSLFGSVRRAFQAVSYTHLEEWSNDDVWLFLMQHENPWGYNNKDLLTMYQGASADGECPLVVDTSTPSCGDSRFGCWVCTLVEEDKSMRAMIQNDEDKEWMLPLLKLRNKLDAPNDREIRDFRRMSGLVQIFHNDPIPGPYTQRARAEWLSEVLRAQEAIRRSPTTPDNVRNIELITINELKEIRRLWVIEKHEIEDLLPSIYERETGESFPDQTMLESSPWGPEEFESLKEICGPDNDLQYQMIRELLHVEQRYRTASRRAGLYEALEDAIRRSFYDSEEDAVGRARRRHEAVSYTHLDVYKRQHRDGARAH